MILPQEASRGNQDAVSLCTDIRGPQCLSTKPMALGPDSRDPTHIWLSLWPQRDPGNPHVLECKAGMSPYLSVGLTEGQGTHPVEDPLWDEVRRPKIYTHALTTLFLGM